MGLSGNILVILHQSLSQLKRGDNIRIMSICEAMLKAGAQLDLLQLLDAKDGNSDKSHLSPFRNIFEVETPLSSPELSGTHCSIISENTKAGYISTLSPENMVPFNFIAKVKGLLWSGHYDKVCVFNSEALSTAIPCPPFVKLIFCPCDIQSVTHERMEEAGIQTGKNIELMRYEEESLIKHCDLVATVSARDAFEAKKLGASNTVVIKEPVLPLDLGKSYDKSKRIFFIGSDSPINRNAISYFLDSIWPLVLAKEADAVFCVAGGICASLSGQEKNIEIQGYTDDLANSYRNADIAIAPIKVKTGIYIKVLEAMSHQTPLVASPEANWGLEIPEEIISIAASPEAFAERIVHLLQNPELRRDYAEKAFAFVRNNFSENTVFTDFLERLNSLKNEQTFSGKGTVKEASALKTEQILSRLKEAGVSRIALYGAGKHTIRLLQQVRWGSLKPCAVIDDSPVGKSIMGIEVSTPDALFSKNSKIQALIISSDAHEKEMYHKIMKLKGNHPLEVFTLYM